MKKAAIVTMTLLLLALVLTGWLYATCAVTVTGSTTIATGAEDQAAVFEELREQILNGTASGITFSEAVTEDPADWQFLTYTVRLRNGTFVTADLIEVQLRPMSGDALQLGTTQAQALAGQSEGDLQVTLLTRTGGSPAREAVITYYLWGLPFTLKTTVGH